MFERFPAGAELWWPLGGEELPGAPGLIVRLLPQQVPGPRGLEQTLRMRASRRPLLSAVVMT